MAKTKISEFDTNADNNTDINNINIAEGCAPSGINNAIRQLMADLKEWQSGAGDYYIAPAGTVSTPAFTTTGDTNTGIFFPAADTIAFAEGGVEAMRIDSSGKVGIGNSSPTYKLDVYDATGAYSRLAGDSATQFIVSRASTDNIGGFVQLYKARGTQASPTIVADNDITGRMVFYGYDGANYTQTAEIRSTVNGTPGTNDMPGQLIFYTTADGASTVTERMRIDSSGNVGIGVTPTLAKLHVFASNSGDEGIYAETTGNGAAFYGVSPTGYILYGTTGGTTVSDIYCTDSTSAGMNVYYRKEGGSPADNDSILLIRAYGEDSALNSQEYTRITSRIVDTASGSEDAEIIFSVVSAGTLSSKMTISESGTFIPDAYTLTTASAANVFVASSGLLSRSTSSIQYKTQVEDLDQQNSANIYNMRPVWYRSTCANDNKNWSWYGLIAEEVAEIDPRLVHWGYANDQYDITYVENDGQKEEVKTLKENAVMQPEGVQYDRLTVLLIQEIKNLKAELDATKAEVAALKSK